MFEFSNFVVHEVNFSNGTSGRGLFAARDISPTVLPYVGVVVEKRHRPRQQHAVSASYVSSTGKTQTISELVMDGDPSSLHGPWECAALINEPEPHQRPNCVLHLNPALTRRHIMSAFLSGDPIISNFVVTSALKQGEQLLMNYGSEYDRVYAVCDEENLGEQYRDMVLQSHDVLNEFIEHHMEKMDLLHVH